MKLTSTEFVNVVAILRMIDEGSVAPRIPDRIGRFLRQYKGGRADLAQVFRENEAPPRADGALRGQLVGPLQIHPLTTPHLVIHEFPIGEVADTLAISEELGSVIVVTTWLKSPTANAAFNLLRSSTSFRCEGDHRWTPLAKWTPGESEVKAVELTLDWTQMRCIKAVADDIHRPPHALEYVLDFQLGHAGLKFFRTICVLKRAGTWRVLPALEQPRELATSGIGLRHLTDFQDGQLAMCLVYREPWDERWAIVAANTVSPSDALAHAITWADFQCELQENHVDGEIVRGIRESLNAAGLRAAAAPEPNIEQFLLPISRDVIRRIRRLA